MCPSTLSKNDPHSCGKPLSYTLLFASSSVRPTNRFVVRLGAWNLRPCTPGHEPTRILESQDAEQSPDLLPVVTSLLVQLPVVTPDCTQIWQRWMAACFTTTITTTSRMRLPPKYDLHYCSGYGCSSIVTRNISSTTAIVLCCRKKKKK